MEIPTPPFKYASSFQLFIAGYLFDFDNVSYQEFPQDLIYAICTRTCMQFNYESNFDKNGALWWFANDLSSCTINKELMIPLLKDFSYYYISRYENEKVKQSDTLKILGKSVEGTYHSNYYFEDKNIPYIDLQQFKLCISHITIAHSNESFLSPPIPAVFYGSNDLIEWKTIVVEKEDYRIMEQVDIEALKIVRTWKLQTKCYFRYFKLPNRIKSSSSNQFYYKTSLSGIELYGNLI
jgi:hypothetical protein